MASHISINYCVFSKLKDLSSGIMSSVLVATTTSSSAAAFKGCMLRALSTIVTSTAAAAAGVSQPPIMSRNLATPAVLLYNFRRSHHSIAFNSNIGDSSNGINGSNSFSILNSSNSMSSCISRRSNSNSNNRYSGSSSNLSGCILSSTRLSSAGLLHKQSTRRGIASAIFLKGFPSDAPIELLKEELAVYGNVQSIHIIMRDAAPTATALVHFETITGAIECAEDLNKSFFMGRRVTVDYSTKAPYGMELKNQMARMSVKSLGTWAAPYDTSDRARSSNSKSSNSSNSNPSNKAGSPVTETGDNVTVEGGEVSSKQQSRSSSNVDTIGSILNGSINNSENSNNKISSNSSNSSSNSNNSSGSESDSK